MRIIQTLVPSQIKNGILDILKEAQPIFPKSNSSIRIPIFFDEDDFPTYVNLGGWKFNTPMLTGLTNWYKKNSATASDEVVIEMLEKECHLRIQKANRLSSSEPFWEKADLIRSIEELPDVERTKALLSLELLQYSYSIAPLIMKTRKVWDAFWAYQQTSGKGTVKDPAFRPFSAIGSAMDDLYRIRVDSEHIKIPADDKTPSIHLRWLETIDYGLRFFKYFSDYLFGEEDKKKSAEHYQESFGERLRVFEENCASMLDSLTNELAEELGIDPSDLK